MERHSSRQTHMTSIQTIIVKVNGEGAKVQFLLTNTELLRYFFDTICSLNLV